MKPHYLNDFITSTFKKQGEFANWVVETNPFEGGSDHTPFLQADIPGLLLWHFTDQFYHTDNDRIDKVSQETMKNVGTAALVSGLTLVNSNTAFALEQISLLEQKAIDRLQIEFQLSVNAIKNGNAIENEKAILEAWEDWYVKAISTTNDVVSKSNGNIKDAIKESRSRLTLKSQKLIKNLNTSSKN